jgi:hypothetical protein
MDIESMLRNFNPTIDEKVKKDEKALKESTEKRKSERDAKSKT